MKILISMLILLTLVVPSVSIPESVQMGGYNLSFDIGQNALNISLPTEISTETLDGTPLNQSSVTITGNDKCIMVIGVGKSSRMATSDIKHEMKEMLKNTVKTEAPVYDRTIDGHDGAISNFEGPDDSNWYSAMWLMNNTTGVFVMSSYPWDEGTLSFLKTIHIEKDIK